MVLMLVTPVAVPVAQQASPQAPPPAAQAGQPIPGTTTCPVPAPPAKMPERSFIAPAGLVLIPVLPTKVGDFEKFLGYVNEALAKSTDPTVRAQAKGWRMFKVPEPGPNGDALFAFLMEPAVPCVDYSLVSIMNAAFADGKQLEEIWALYKRSVRSGGTLMNLIPVTPPK